MGKAILVLDEMPRWCGECPYCRDETIMDCASTYCALLNQDITWNGNRVDDCPLKQAPEAFTEEQITDWKISNNMALIRDGYNRGLEACGVLEDE